MIAKMGYSYAGNVGLASASTLADLGGNVRRVTLAPAGRECEACHKRLAQMNLEDRCFVCLRRSQAQRMRGVGLIGGGPMTQSSLNRSAAMLRRSR